jgi:hypothetical protein
MVRFFLALGLLLASVLPAAAQSPEEIVRWIYASTVQPQPTAARGLDYLSAPEQRGQYFSRRMVAFYDANDTYGDNLAEACLDFGFAIPGQDYDAAEILGSLAITAAPGADRTRVVARFTTFGQPAEIIYDFIPEDGFWKIDDIAGPGFRASQIPCTPKAASAAAPADAFCYQTDSSALRLILSGPGAPSFDVSSWQSNGHSCSAQGPVRAVEGGWVHEVDLSGRLCRLGIEITPDQGLRLSDPDFACKMWMCGQRASLDGLTFPRSSQVDCAQMRDMGN